MPSSWQSGELRDTVTGALTISPIGPEIQLDGYGVNAPAITTPDAALATAKAANPGGGTFVWPAGVFLIGGTTAVPVNHDLTGAQYNMKGQGIGVTTLACPSNGATALFVTHRLEVVFEDLSIVGPGVGGNGTTTVGSGVVIANVASAPTRIGVVARDRCTMNRVRVTGFGMNVVNDGNHQVFTNCSFKDGKYNLTFAPNIQGYVTTQASTFTHGNQVLINVDLTGAGECSILLKDDFIDSALLQEVHMGFCPVGIQAEAKVVSEAAITNTTFIGCSFESVGENYMLDKGYLTANRRLFKGLRWYDQHDGPMSTTYSRTGLIGTEMVKLGEIIDWKIYGFVGDASNSTFPITCGVGGCGFLAETIQNFTFYSADQLWGDAAAQVKPMFRIGTGGGWGGPTLNNVFVTCFNRYTSAIMRNNTGSTIADGKVLMNANAGEPWGAGFTGGYDVALATNTRVPLGRAAGAGPLTTGNLIPVVVYGESNTLVATTVAGIVAGSPLVADAANPGNVKLAAAFTDAVIATATAAPSGNNVESIVHSRLQLVP